MNMNILKKLVKARDEMLKAKETSVALAKAHMANSAIEAAASKKYFDLERKFREGGKKK
jgi:hypothetical protein